MKFHSFLDSAPVIGLVVLFTCLACSAQTETTSPPSTGDMPCSSLIEKCETCLKNVSCYWCNTPDDGDLKCQPYPVGDLLPTKKCDLSDARWGVCWVNFEALIISMSVIAFLLLFGCTCGIYCCCCRSKGNKKKWQREDAKLEQQREERKMQNEAKRADRKAKNDEIRRKYGLVKEGEGYTKFDDDK